MIGDARVVLIGEASRGTLPDLFDAVIHLDEPRALGPLEKWLHDEAPDLPETFPTGV